MADKHPGGRPSAYKPEYIPQARMLCKLGAIDKDLAEFFGVSEQTINAWKNKYPEFLDALKEAKDEADSKVEKSLYKRALGYKHKEDKIFNNNGSPLVVPTIKQYPPDVTACIFWLKNRKPEEWRDRQEIEHSGTIKPDLSNLSLEEKKALANIGRKLRS